MIENEPTCMVGLAGNEYHKGTLCDRHVHVSILILLVNEKYQFS